MRVVPFDVPGHKRGRGNPELTAFLGEQCVNLDVNSMKPLDNLCHPVSVIKRAEELAAEAFGAAAAFLMIGGTTSAVQSMILTVCKQGDQIILPRNVHRSVLNAMVLCGARPVYVNPDVNPDLGIALGMRPEQVEAKAVLINNPTYYGVCSDIKAIVDLAHRHNMLALADEAHGTHFYFGDNLPPAAMHVGADMAAVSMHKSGGSLTQSSFLLGPNISPGYCRQIINLTQTTSASYLLLSSLDISRRKLALEGRQIFAQVLKLAEYAREEINSIGDYWAFGAELVQSGTAVANFDRTKLSVNTLNVGLAGIEVYDILRDEYDIQIEFGDLGNILAYISIGDRQRDIERLVSALAEIRRRYKRDKSGLLTQEYIEPQVELTPQQAFYAPKESLPLAQTRGRICSEFVMCYPPGIPIVAPGEKITEQILAYISYAKQKGSSLTGPEDAQIEYLNVIK